MKWRKLGLLYSPGQTSHPKLLSHAANPLPVHLEGDVYRVFFSGRDYRNRSSVGAVDIDIVKLEIVGHHQSPIFEHGPEGSYYADGVSIGCCYRVAEKTYMTFMGWCNPQDAHWRGELGRLRLTDDNQLCIEEDDRDQPFLSRLRMDSISLSYPCILGDEGAGYRMWYGSTLTWDAGNGEMLHVLMSACSSDGSKWEPEGIAVPYELGVAQAFSRPSVVKNTDGTYEMWFGYRGGIGTTYRIGYATSPDGRNWSPCLTQSGIDVSDSGWDSEMIEYPFVFGHSGERYLLYNGNHYGATGFGMAIWED